MVRITDDSGSVTKCILDPYEEELSALEEVTRREAWARELAIQLMGRVGCRADEVTYPSAESLRWSSSGECWFLEIRGKNTSGEDGSKKTRDAWIPGGVAENIQRFASKHERDPGEPLVDASTSSVRRWVHEARQQLADDRTDRWEYVSSHDLRRSWATHHLVERGTDVRTMMSIGGWSSYDAIEPYLGAPTDERIGEVMGSDEHNNRRRRAPPNI
jgi:Phage integrase family.